MSIDNGSMHVDRVKNRNGAITVLVRESYRDDGKVKKRTLANITHLPTAIQRSIERQLSCRSPQSGPSWTNHRHLGSHTCSKMQAARGIVPWSLDGLGAMMVSCRRPEASGDATTLLFVGSSAKRAARSSRADLVFQDRPLPGGGGCRRRISSRRSPWTSSPSSFTPRSRS